MSDGRDRTDQFRKKLSIANFIQSIIAFSVCYTFLKCYIYWFYLANKNKFKENYISLSDSCLYNMLIMSEGQSCRKDKCHFSTSLVKLFQTE